MKDPTKDPPQAIRRHDGTGMSKKRDYGPKKWRVWRSGVQFAWQILRVIVNREFRDLRKSRWICSGKGAATKSGTFFTLKWGNSYGKMEIRGIRRFKGDEGGISTGSSQMYATP